MKEAIAGALRRTFFETFNSRQATTMETARAEATGGLAFCPIGFLSSVERWLNMAQTRLDKRAHRPGGSASIKERNASRKERGRMRGKGAEHKAPSVKLGVFFGALDLDSVLSIASEVAHCVDLFCVGSSLIKKEGIRAIRGLTAGFPEREIFADLRASAGAKEEVSMAFESGADLVSVSVTASDKECLEAIGLTQTFGGKAVLDLYGAPDAVAASKRALDLGFDYIYFSAEGGISRQYEVYRRVANSARLPLIVDGELEFRDFARVSKLLPSIVAIGKQITEATDPASAAERFAELVHRRRAA